MKIYFSNTKHINRNVWSATVAPATIRKGFQPLVGHLYHNGNEFSGEVIATTKKGEVHIKCKYGFPCVGVPYSTEMITFAQ